MGEAKEGGLIADPYDGSIIVVTSSIHREFDTTKYHCVRPTSYLCMYTSLAQE